MENITDIKFKAVRRDCSSGGFIDGYYVHIKDENRDEHYIVDTDGIKTEIYPDSLCLFTGFKDSNGVEVLNSKNKKYSIKYKTIQKLLKTSSGFLVILTRN